MSDIRKIVLLSIGWFCLVVGVIGIFMPILPTVPFFIVTIYCFSRGSSKLHIWFLGTDMYKKHLKKFHESGGISTKAKKGIFIGVTSSMTLGFIVLLYFELYVPAGMLAFTWVFYMWYILFHLPTIDVVEQSDIQYPYDKKN